MLAIRLPSRRLLAELTRTAARLGRSQQSYVVALIKAGIRADREATR